MFCICKLEIGLGLNITRFVFEAVSWVIRELAYCVDPCRQKFVNWNLAWALIQYSSFIVHQNCMYFNGVLMHNKWRALYDGGFDSLYMFIKIKSCKNFNHTKRLSHRGTKSDDDVLSVESTPSSPVSVANSACCRRGVCRSSTNAQLWLISGPFYTVDNIFKRIRHRWFELITTHLSTHRT